MNTRWLFPLVGLGAALLSPGIASATFILDTGTPPSGGAEESLTTQTALAVEFQASAADPYVTQLSVYLGPSAQDSGETFTWDLYSAGNAFLNVSAANRGPVLATATGTAISGSGGWDTVSVSGSAWTLTPGQDYWIAVQESTTGYSIPVTAGNSTTTGTVPALAFAYTTGGEYKSSASAPAIGVQITAVPVPAAAWLLGSGLLGLGSLSWGRRRR